MLGHNCSKLFEQPRDVLKGSFDLLNGIRATHALGINLLHFHNGCLATWVVSSRMTRIILSWFLGLDVHARPHIFSSIDSRLNRSSLCWLILFQTPTSSEIYSVVISSARVSIGRRYLPPNRHEPLLLGLLLLKSRLPLLQRAFKFLNQSEASKFDDIVAGFDAGLEAAVRHSDLGCQLVDFFCILLHFVDCL